MYGSDGDESLAEIIASVQRVLNVSPGEEVDPLDALVTKFNPVDILNEYFPDEVSLGQISAVQLLLAERENQLRQEIESLQEELKRDHDPTRMQVIQEMISDLLGQISRIREKATESEAVVRNITKDIQNLDLAKKNLILSMNTLKRLQMLVNALTQLEEQSKNRRYAEVAQTLAAVKQTSASFQPLTSVQRIQQLWKRIQEVQGEIRSKVDADFEAFYVQNPANPVKPTLIADACSVVDVLGPDVRAQLVDKYVLLELKEYRRIFRATDEAGQLDNLSRRFAWFRRLLQTHEVEHGRVFPSEWRVGWHLFAKFVEITRDDMSTLLAKAGSSLTVTLLLDTLQQTTLFETSMAKKWATSVDEILKTTSSAPARPNKLISSAFEPHMGIFVDAQDKALSDMLAPYRGSNPAKNRASLDGTPRASVEDDGGGSSPTVVLPSSTQLFYFYRQSLERCAMLSTGQALFDLCQVHKKWLRIYAEDVLMPSLKRGPPPVRRSMDSRLDSAALEGACLAINTADYCQATALELEEKMKEKISVEHKENISLQSERDLFVNVISNAILVLLRELDSACEPAIGIMARTVWGNLNQVSGNSSYVADLVKVVEQVSEIIKPLVEQKKYLRNFFDKASSLILSKFTNALVKSRPLKEIGAEQLLIDLQVVRSCLLKLPGESSSSSSYARSLTKSTTRIEALLKVVVTPVDPPEGFILNYTLLIGDASFSNFQKILDLKGTPRAEQSDLLDSFLTITSTKDGLENTSFLSSLDMDPPVTALFGQTFASPVGTRVGSPVLGAIAGDNLFSALSSPPLSKPSTASNGDVSKIGEPGQKREVFSDIRRFVSFGLRRDTQPPS